MPNDWQCLRINGEVCPNYIHDQSSCKSSLRDGSGRCRNDTIDLVAEEADQGPASKMIGQSVSVHHQVIGAAQDEAASVIVLTGWLREMHAAGYHRLLINYHVLVGLPGESWPGWVDRDLST